MTLRLELLRRYPHIVFRRNWELASSVHYQLGECSALVSAICEMPIRPEYHQRLLSVSLVKGAQSTTAIEGNTLTDEEVAKVARGESLPPSKEYQEREVRNVLEAMNTLRDVVARENRTELISPELIRRFHALVGKNLGEHFDAIPGHFRTDERVVGPYRCPRHEDVPLLVEQLCRWLRQEFTFESSRQTFADAVVQAIVTHVYIEWIHPFGDGNGRTGRLLEFYILLRAGNPDIASHILSNHYNLTRPEYYRRLQKANDDRDLSAFIAYAVQGYRDGLVESLAQIQRSQFEMAWRTLIYDRFAIRKYRKKGVFKRQRDLILSMPIDREMPPRGLRLISPEVARDYATMSDRTLMRDLDVLREMKLVVERNGLFRPATEQLRHQMAARRRNTPGSGRPSSQREERTP